jgi:hypothetical protein
MDQFVSHFARPLSFRGANYVWAENVNLEELNFTYFLSCEFKSRY